MEDSDKLQNAPLERVPQQEVEVIFLFSQLFRNYGFTKIKKIETSTYPDCIAYRKTKSGIREVRIEFELESINFKIHGHDPKKCDCIVCWEHNWHEKPKDLEVVQLREYYGYSPKIWVMAVGKNYKEELLEADESEWSVSPKSHVGDLVLFYHNTPDKCIKDIFEITGESFKDKAGDYTRKKYDIFAHVKRIARIHSPLFYDEMKIDKYLSTSQMIEGNMQGKFDVTAYWHRIYELIIAKNPSIKKVLSEFSPEKIYR